MFTTPFREFVRAPIVADHSVFAKAEACLHMFRVRNDMTGLDLAFVLQQPGVKLPVTQRSVPADPAYLPFDAPPCASARHCSHVFDGVVPGEPEYAITLKLSSPYYTA